MTRLVKTKENINGLPIGFQEVEYLQSSGTEWIDTGVTINTATDEVEMYFQLISTTLYQWLMGEHDNGARFGVGVGDGTNKRNIAYGATTYKVNDTQVYNSIHKFVANSNGVYLDGVQVHAFESFSSTSTIYLFNLNISGGAGLASGKIWTYRHKRNGVLIRDLIPCLDNNGTPCMWDTITKKPYHNQGTGTFTYGRQIIPVEYLESAGSNNYIATGLDYFADYEIGIKLRNNVSNKALGNSATNCMQRYNATNPYWSFTSGGTNAFTPNALITDYHVMKWKDGKIYTDDVLITEKAKDKGTTEMTLFGAGAYFPNMIYFCKLWNPDDGTLVRDYIPAIDENNTPFMFDKVTHTVYLNAGTGTFSYGSPVYTTKTRLIKDGYTKDRLPIGFKRVEYLQSNGTQYIDTGVYPTQLTKVEYRCAVTGSVSNVDSHLFGSRLSASSEAFDLAYMNTSPNGIEKFRFIHGTTTTQETTTSVTASQLANPHTYYMSGTSFKVDGSEKMSFTTTSFTGTYSLWLFGVNNAGSLHNQVRAQRVYKCKIWDNNTLVRDFIPCLDTTNTPCMYDTVTQTAFYNHGTGAFNYGNILPNKIRLIPSWLDDYTFVNYIQSTGTQYIDTGITLTNNHSVEIDYQLTQASQSRAGLFGNLNMTGSNQGRFGSLLSPSNQQLEHGYGTGNDYWQQGSPDTNRHKLYQKKNEIYFDGTLIHTFASATFTLNTTALLGNFAYTNYTPAKAKYYNSKWWDGDTLIRNFIPAIRKSDSAVGMLDLVNKVFYTNQGTGVFSYG